MDLQHDQVAKATPKARSSRFRNALAFAVGMVTPATMAALWFGILTRPDRWNTSTIVLSAIAFALGEAFFIATALVAFLLASALLRRGAPIPPQLLFWTGSATGCMPALATLFIDDAAMPQVVMGWVALAFCAAVAVLIVWGKRTHPIPAT